MNYADMALRDFEDGYDYDAGWEQQCQCDAVEAKFVGNLRDLGAMLETNGCDLDITGDECIRINGGKFDVYDALVLACFSTDPAQRQLILDDCRRELIPMMAELGWYEAPGRLA